LVEEVLKEKDQTITREAITQAAHFHFERADADKSLTIDETEFLYVYSTLLKKRE